MDAQEQLHVTRIRVEAVEAALSIPPGKESASFPAGSDIRNDSPVITDP